MIENIKKIKEWWSLKRQQGAWTPLTGHIPPTRSLITPYSRRAFRVLLEALVLLAVTSIGFMGLLFLFEILWNVFQNTHIGQQYAIMHDGDLPFLTFLLEANIPFFCAELTICAFAICMTVSGVCRVFEITQYFYDSRGVMGQIGFWGLPLAAILSMLVQSIYNMEDSMTAMTFAAIPTLAIFRQCFRFSYELFPEVSDILRPFPIPFRAWEIGRQTLLLILLSALATGGLLYIVKLIGQGEIVMLVGWNYIPEAGEWGLIPFALSEVDIIFFSMEVALNTLVVCLAGGALWQLAQIPRAFYLNIPYPLQVACLGAPMALATTFWLQSQMGIDTFESALVLAIPPVMCMFHGCALLANEFVPEAGEIYRMAAGKPMKVKKAAPYNPNSE
ncbi:MAG: hypothetical protein GY859_02250 [Desulfobacterales bacterium]|nr:hypothetical protein [Desulfobacterales bacterium]